MKMVRPLSANFPEFLQRTKHGAGPGRIAGVPPTSWLRGPPTLVLELDSGRSFRQSSCLQMPITYPAPSRSTFGSGWNERRTCIRRSTGDDE